MHSAVCWGRVFRCAGQAASRRPGWPPAQGEQRRPVQPNTRPQHTAECITRSKPFEDAAMINELDSLTQNVDRLIAIGHRFYRDNLSLKRKLEHTQAECEQTYTE